MAPKRKVEQQQEEASTRTRPRRTYTPDPTFTRTTRSKSNDAVAAAEVKSKKKQKKVTIAASVEEDENAAADGGAQQVTGKTIVVEYCKQCNSFKTRAFQVKEGLEKAVPGTNVLLNPEKPRRGCFEIREDSGEIFTSLLEMKRPFKPMKDLNMENVIAEIAKKIRS